MSLGSWNFPKVMGGSDSQGHGGVRPLCQFPIYEMEMIPALSTSKCFYEYWWNKICEKQYIKWKCYHQGF